MCHFVHFPIDCAHSFTTLPPCVYELVGLEILLVRDNKLEAIDASSAGLARMPRLATLDLANNDIAQIPNELGNIKTIK